jgi:H+/Cl- antiporter ClcA
MFTACTYTKYSLPIHIAHDMCRLTLHFKISNALLILYMIHNSGLFVPSLLSGAAFGRLCGHLLHKMDFSTDFSSINDATGARAKATFADSGTYALIGT